MLLPAGFAPPAVPVPHPSALILNWPTKLRSWLHISTSCCDAFWVSEAPRVVPWAASATPPMLRVISLLPCAASVTCVTSRWCGGPSTAVAMVLKIPLTWLTTYLLRGRALLQWLHSRPAGWSTGRSGI